MVTGRKVWQFRTLPNDVWDYDLDGQATLMDFAVGGAQVPALSLWPSGPAFGSALDARRSTTTAGQSGFGHLGGDFGPSGAESFDVCDAADRGHCVVCP